jgi:uncharacterized protein (DUF983 family)
MIDLHSLKIGLRGLCPKCEKSRIFNAGLDLSLKDKCPSCGLDLDQSDSADGPAVFLMFILGFLLVPMALWFEFAVHPPLWGHAVLWGAVAIGLTVGTLKPLKGYIIALQYKHRPEDWA